MRLSLFRMGSLLLNNYELVLKSKYLGKVPVEVYRSQRSGLHVALARTQSPAVNCHLVLATAVETNDGLPHTLEHLVFMGSKSIPFKGALDLLSMKALSVGGTNAWTQQDHTAYTVKTIGEAGMRNFVHIFGDHLINPLLTDENYRSEVYHYTPEGEAGVVYSEIQDFENNLDNLVDLELKRQIFPTLPVLHSDYGGRMKEVRELCSLQRVQNYHKQFYHLRNLWVLLCGNINSEEMLKSIDELDSKNCNKPPAEFKRPFIDLVPPDIKRHRSESIVVTGPSDSADEGIVSIGFLSRPAWDATFSMALKIIATYITKTASAPLQKELILCTDPYCESVSVATNELPRCQITMDFQGVPVEKMDSLTDKFFDVLRASTKPECLDMERIKYIIDLKIKKLYAKMESDVSKPIFNNLIGYQLFAQSLDDQKYFEELMDPAGILRDLRNKPAEYWSDLISEIFSDNCVVVLGKPDTKMGEKIAAEEEKRLKALKEKAIAESAKRLKLEEPNNSRDASECASLTLFDDIDFDTNFETFRVETSVIPPGQKTSNSHPELISNLPFNTTLHSMDSNFARVFFLFDLKSVPLRLRKYLLLFDSLLSKSPAFVDGKLLSDQEVANLMVKELMETSYGPGYLDNYKHFFHFYIETPVKEFNLVPRWARILLHDTVFEKDKIVAISKNLANGASSTKRDGHSMCGILLKSLNTVKGHESRFYDDVVLENFHRSLAKELEGPAGDAAAERIINDLKELRQAILNAPMNAQIVCDPNSLGTTVPIPADAWDFLDANKKGQTPADKILIDHNSDVAAFRNDKSAGRVLKLDSCDATYIMTETKTEVPYGSPDHVALVVMASYFSMLEGVLWKEVRGNGYSYGASISYSPTSNLVMLDLYRCSRPKLAYQASKDIVTRIFNERKLDNVLFDLAKRGAVSSLVSRYETLKGTAALTVFDDIRGLEMADIKELIKNAWNAEMWQCFELAKPHFLRLFDEKAGIQSVVCPRNKLEEVKETFKGIEVVTIPDLQYVPE